MYVRSITFPTQEAEFDFFINIKRTVYDSFYPFQILSKRRFERIDFEPITILYGGNGSGKTTALNVIAEKLRLHRDSLFNQSNFFNDYLDFCTVETEAEIPPHSRILTSDDVFDFILSLRALNEGIDQKREELFEEYLDNKYAQFQLKSLQDYETLKKITKPAATPSPAMFARN